VTLADVIERLRGQADGARCYQRAQRSRLSWFERLVRRMLAGNRCARLRAALAAENEGRALIAASNDLVRMARWEVMRTTPVSFLKDQATRSQPLTLASLRSVRR
jgi:hypothetical protein